MTMLALPSGARAERRGALTLTAQLAGVAALSLTGALIAAFLFVDDAVRRFPPDDLAPDNYTAVTTMITLALASGLVEWAVYSIRTVERNQALVAYGLALLLAIAGGNALWYLGSELPFGVATHAYGLLAYAMLTATGVHLALAFGALLFTFFKVAGGQADAPSSELPRATAWFWHSAMFGWFGVFMTLYLFNLMFK